MLAIEWPNANEPSRQYDNILMMAVAVAAANILIGLLWSGADLCDRHIAATALAAAAAAAAAAAPRQDNTRRLIDKLDVCCLCFHFSIRAAPHALVISASPPQVVWQRKQRRFIVCHSWSWHFERRVEFSSPPKLFAPADTHMDTKRDCTNNQIGARRKKRLHTTSEPKPELSRHTQARHSLQHLLLSRRYRIRVEMR